MYIYRRRPAVKKNLAKEKLKQAIRDKICPSCSGQLQLLESEDDKQTYVCTKCHDTSAFAKVPPYVEKKTKEIKLGAITLRDRSNERKYDYKNKGMSENKDVSAEILNTIRDAMSKSKLLQFTYRNDKQATQRVVEPYKLALDGSKNVILYAYCTEGEGIRIFKLGKMEGVSTTEYDYKRRWGIEDKLIDEQSKGP
jgi:hypothetical protein